MKNSSLIGASLLGTWSAEVKLSDHGKDSMTAYFAVHFMADPRRGHGCTLEDCSEVDNQVCMLKSYDEGHIQKVCSEIADEKDVTWSDLNAFFYFGAKIKSESNPKAKFELSVGDWIGPWNLILAQETIPIGVNSTLVDRYVARYVQSQSTMPTFLQNQFPLESTLYTKPDDYATFLGNPALKFMTQAQTKYSIGNETTTNDPYAPYLQTCENGNLQPILPLLELSFLDPNVNHGSNNEKMKNLQMALKIQYKMTAVPTPDEQSYRVLPQIQSKFQGKGAFNILSGPYCYGDDPLRGYSFDLHFDSQHNASGVSFVRGCLPGYPCVPPAAMGGLPILPSNNSCKPDDRPHPTPPPNTNPGGLNVALTIVAYTLAVALAISITLHFHVFGQQRKRDAAAKRQRDIEESSLFRLLGNDNRTTNTTSAVDSKPSYFGDDVELLEGVGIAGADNQREDVNPFGDLDDAEENKADPLQEPLLP